MNRRIAFFDFDGTITTRDTLLEFIKFSRGRVRFWMGFVLYSPWLLAFKLKIIPNQLAKEKILGWFFRDVSLNDFQAVCDLFAAEILPSLIRPKALTEFTRLREAGVEEIVIVSASPENWIRPWTDMHGFRLLATKLKAPAGKLTGKIEGRNCHGTEKVERIRACFDLSEYSEVYAYGDSSGDKQMLETANISFYKPFR
jgi:HAD superfamily hydrolase (TIGR01490 family)